MPFSRRSLASFLTPCRGVGRVVVGQAELLPGGHAEPLADAHGAPLPNGRKGTPVARWGQGARQGATRTGTTSVKRYVPSSREAERHADQRLLAQVRQVVPDVEGHADAVDPTAVRRFVLEFGDHEVVVLLFLPVGGVTIPPEACCTTTVAEVMSSGRSSPTFSLLASSVRRTVTLKVDVPVVLAHLVRFVGLLDRVEAAGGARRRGRVRR